ncbi:rCG25023 [Rattus norvegicus]|uniref:RCG25023 n=1 Tax=Rattus norvegicus TaxID=10116 RepID=A6KFH0_RAT|nr:rCG25023 [Rattus norvegicus]
MSSLKESWTLENNMHWPFLMWQRSVCAGPLWEQPEDTERKSCTKPKINE